MDWIIDEEVGEKLSIFKPVNEESILIFKITNYQMSGFKVFKKFATSLPIAIDSAERNINLNLQNFVNASNNEKLRQVIFSCRK